MNNPRGEFNHVSVLTAPLIATVDDGTKKERNGEMEGRNLPERDNHKGRSAAFPFYRCGN